MATAAIVSLQFIPPVRKALALVSEFEVARASLDAQAVSRLLAPGVFADLDQARKLALTGPEQDVRNLSFGDVLLVLTLRSAVIEKRLDYRVVRDGAPATLHVAMLQANTKITGVPVPVSVSVPLFGIPAGPGRIYVWIGPAQAPSFLGYVFSVWWNLRGEVITMPDGKLVFDPSAMTRASAQENARLLGGSTGRPSDAVLLAYLRYKGEAQKIWQPLDVSQGEGK